VNVADSVRARLTTEARNSGDDFQLVIRRYFFERFLARLSTSKARDRFVLKGAMLLQLWADHPYRATTDLDLMHRGPSDREALRQDLVSVLDTTIEDDGVAFDAESLELEEIRAADEYAGTRCHFEARLGTIRDRLQIDVGVSDAVWPKPEKMKYPTLLGSEPPIILTYSPESVIAEKLEAMIVLGMTNSRIKDFVDVHYLASAFPFDAATQVEAIRRTFARRKTAVPESEPVALTDEFWTHAGRAMQVRAFARRARLDISLEDAERMLPLLRSFLLPLLDAVRRGTNFDATWLPGGPWRG
jgi:Nucleotidyl transferase AbiEii toxin, Type IV TA system